MDVSDLILSDPTKRKAEYILITMNEELLAASALFVQSGALLVSHNGFINFLQFSNVKPTQVCSAPAGHLVISTTLVAPEKGIVTSILPLKRPTILRH